MQPNQHPDALLHVGNNVDQSDTTVAAAAAAIVSILKVGAETHTDQGTLRHALTTLISIPGVHDVTIQDCTLTGGQVAVEVS